MFVLVVTRRASVGELVRQTLGAEGWWVTAVADRETAVRSASGQAPQLVVVDGEIDKAAELVRFFSRRHGGPGVLLLAPADGDEEAGAAEADEVMGQSAGADELAAAAGRLLEEPQESPDGGLPTPGQVLNAQDIFGDMLLELEGDSALAEPPLPPPAAPRRAVAERTGGGGVASAAAPVPEPPTESAPSPIAPIDPLDVEPPLDTRPMVIPQPSPEVQAPLDIEAEIDTAVETVIGPDPAPPTGGDDRGRSGFPMAVADPPGDDGEEASAAPLATAAADDAAPAAVESVDGPEMDERAGDRALAEEPRPIGERGEREEEAAAAATAPTDPEPAGDEDVEATAASDPLPPSEEAATALPPPPDAPGAPWWKRASLPGGVRFWLGLAAGLLVFLAASFLLERVFSEPAGEPAPVTVPATNTVDLEELVDQEMAKREAELRESLLEEERRLQQQLDETKDDS